VDGTPEQRSDASSGFSGALYDPSGRDAASTVGAPQTPPAWAAPAGPMMTPPPVSTPGDDSAWWSAGSTDPWRDPYAPAAVIVPAPETPSPVEPPDFDKRGRNASLTQVLLISVLAALLAGALGGALGYNVAVRHGATGGTVLGGGSPSGLTQRAPTSLAGVAKSVMPSVVTVRVDDGLGAAAIGSGFIVSSNGYVVTNDHVVQGLNRPATVMFSDYSTASATLVGADPESDIAVLKVAKTGLPAVTFGDSDAVAVGDPVLAIGAPFDLPNTVTYGIVSALRRPLEISAGAGPTRFYSAIQTDAAVNHGNSGGPLIDASGRVVGVDAAIESPGASNSDQGGNIGLAFAIPINQARRVAQQIIGGGKVVHTVIGASPPTSYTPDPNGGVPIASVTPAGPADNAGLKPGDLVLLIGGSLLTSAGDLTALVRQYAPDTIVPVVYLRNGVRHTAQVKLVSGSG
jgi:putative serine protease PepD